MFRIIIYNMSSIEQTPINVVISKSSSNKFVATLYFTGFYFQLFNLLTIRMLLSKIYFLL